MQTRLLLLLFKAGVVFLFDNEFKVFFFPTSRGLEFIQPIINSQSPQFTLLIYSNITWLQRDNIFIYFLKIIISTNINK